MPHPLPHISAFARLCDLAEHLGFRVLIEHVDEAGNTVHTRTPTHGRARRRVVVESAFHRYYAVEKTAGGCSLDELALNVVETMRGAGVVPL